VTETGLPLFPDASPSDGLLDVGVATADSVWQWLRVLSRVARGRPERSPLIQTTRGKKIVIQRARKAAYELDGGVRPAAKKLKVRIKAGAINLCLPVAYRRP
jgi:diacylglycerol kinase family enzyme